MKTLRSKFLVTLIATLFLCLSLAIAFAFNTQKVSADVDNNKFAMAEGAQIALNKDGLRFRVQMGQNVYDQIFTNDAEDNVKLSVLIAPKSFFDAVTDGEYQNLSKKIEIQIDDQQKVYQKDGYYYANAVLTNLAMENNEKITKDQFDYDFVAVGCIATTDGEATSYQYASFFDGDMANNVRSQYELAQAAVLAEDDEDLAIASDVLAEEGPYASWIGSENYPINVDEESEYSILQAKVVAGLDTNAKFNVYNKFDLGEKENLPANTTFFHYVNFFDKDGETLLDTVMVKEGDTAETAQTGKTYQQNDYPNGVIYRVTLVDWVRIVDTQAVADLTNITKNMTVYAYYSRARMESELIAEAKAEQPNGVLFYDRQVGFTQVSSNNGIPVARSYVTDVKWGNEAGSTKLTYTNLTSTNPWINVAKYTGTANDGDYIMFRAYVDFGDEVTYVDIKHSNTPGVRIWNHTWGSVIFPASGFGSSALRLEIAGKDTTNGTSGSFYFSNGKYIPASEALDLRNAVTTTNTLSIGNVELTGVSTYGYNGISTQGKHDKTPNDAVFTQAFNYEPFFIDGEIFYYHQNNGNGGLWLNFKEGINSKLYITARGLGEKPGIYAWKTNGDLELGGWTSPTSVVDAGNGYKTYCWDFTGKDLGKLRFHTAEEASRAGFRQVAISDIRVGA